MNAVGDTVKTSRGDRSKVRRQQLLDAACALIFERGYESVSIADIGYAAQVSGPAVYRHFASKADILATLCNQTIDRLIELVGPRRSDPREELDALLRGQVRLTVRHGMLIRVFTDEERSLPEEVRHVVRRREREHAQRWIDALRALGPSREPVEIEIEAFATVGLILSAARWPASLRREAGLERALLGIARRALNARTCSPGDQTGPDA